jgi:hypothetical protein
LESVEKRNLHVHTDERNETVVDASESAGCRVAGEFETFMFILQGLAIATVLGVVVGLATGIIGWTLGLFNGGWLAGGILGAIMAVLLTKGWTGELDALAPAGFIGFIYGAVVGLCHGLHGTFDQFFVAGATIGGVAGLIFWTVWSWLDARHPR